MAKKSGLKPRQQTPASRQYGQASPRGGKGREVTAVRGAPLPPTTKRDSTYKLVDPTKKRSGRA